MHCNSTHFTDEVLGKNIFKDSRCRLILHVEQSTVIIGHRVIKSTNMAICIRLQIEAMLTNSSYKNI